MPEMKKLVLKVDVNDAKEKQKAMKVVSGLSGIDSLSMDLNERKLTVVGDVDPVNIVSKLRKNWHTEILTVGPAKEPEKKEGDNKKEDEKKKDGEKKDDKKPKTEAEIYQELLHAYNVHNANYMAHHHQPQYVVHHGVEENPNGCVIC